uniref:Uncharacterized protein n=1 Tax=Romanomermis culicivorax TaxID=13658 RepID=A0A915J4R1_ROMCU
MKNDEIDISPVCPSSTNLLCSSPLPVATSKNFAVVGSITDAEKKSQEKVSKKFVHENRSKLIQERMELEKQRLLNEIKMSEEKAEKKRRLLDEERSRRSSALREREQQRIASAAERRRQLEQEKLAAKKIAANDLSTVTGAPPSTARKPSANLMSTSMIVTPFTPRFSAKTSHDQKPGGFAFGSSTPRGLTFLANGQLKSKMSVDNLNVSSTTQTASAAAVVAKVSSPGHRQTKSSRNRDSMVASMYVAPAKNPPSRRSVLTAKESVNNVESASKNSTHKLSRPSTTANTKSMKSPKSSQQLKVDDGSSKVVNSENSTGITEKSTIIDANFSPHTSKVGNLSCEIDINLLDAKVEIGESLQSTETAPDNNEMLQLKSSDSAGKLIENDNGASSKKSAVMTEDEARQALAERRRLAREQAEREKESERQRLEAEKAAEEAEFKRQEEEELRLLREAQQAEVERLREAHEKQKVKMEEEQLEKQRVEMEKIKSIEIDRKNKELAEKQEKEREEKMKQDELDRLERKKKLDEIRRRTRINQTPSYNSLSSSVAPLTNGDEVVVSSHDNVNNNNNNNNNGIENRSNIAVHQSDSIINGEKLNSSTSMNIEADNLALHDDIVNANQSVNIEGFSNAENVIKVTTNRDHVTQKDNCCSPSSTDDEEDILRQKFDNTNLSQNSTTATSETDRKDANLNDIVTGLNNVTLQQRQNDQLKKESYLADDSPNQTLIEF